MTASLLRRVAATAAVLALTACAPGGSAGEDAEVEVPPPVDYVALGDSYTAGPLIPTVTGGGCVRSDRNYPSLVSAGMETATFVDVSCSGAQTRDLRRSQTTFGGGSVPPQADALRPETDLVTLGMGGNDYGLFGSMVSTCQQVRASDPDGRPCKRAFTVTAGGERVDTKLRDARRVQGRVERALDVVAERSPDAEVLVVGYPRLLPSEGTCRAVPFADGDYAWAARVQRLLNRSLRLAAESRGATYVDTFPASRGHDACAGKDAWINGATNDLSRAAAFHPFAEGMEGVASVVLATIATD